MRVQLPSGLWNIDWDHAHFAPRPLPSGRGEVWVKAATTCIITPAAAPDDDTCLGFLGVAWCSVEDSFEKEKGRKISLTRALEKWGLPREERARVWEQYWGRG